MEIILAKTEDSKKLTEITKVSKAYWGYSIAQLKLWDADLTITENDIAENKVMKVLENNEIIAYYSLKKAEGKKVKLDNLFVLPGYIGKGIGSTLLNNAIQYCLKLNCIEVWLESDPNATNFYLKHGFKVIAQKESSVPGRYLPIMSKTI